MTFRLRGSMVKYSRSRNAKYNYSMIKITRILDSLGWKYTTGPGASMILFFQKDFEDRDQAMAGRKDLDFALAPHGYRFDQAGPHKFYEWPDDVIIP